MQVQRRVDHGTQETTVEVNAKDFGTQETTVEVNGTLTYTHTPPTQTPPITQVGTCTTTDTTTQDPQELSQQSGMGILLDTQEECEQWDDSLVDPSLLRIDGHGDLPVWFFQSVVSMLRKGS